MMTFADALTEALQEKTLTETTKPTIEDIEKGKEPKLKFKQVADIIASGKAKVSDLSTGKEVTDTKTLATTVKELSKNPQAKVYWSYDKKTKEVYIGVTESITKQYKVVIQ